MAQRSKLSVRSIAGAYHLEIIANPPDRRRRDLGNLEKPISDFLTTVGIVEDDSLAQSILMKWANTMCLAPGKGEVLIAVSSAVLALKG